MTASNRRPLYSESGDDGITGRPQRRRNGGGSSRRARGGADADANDAALATTPADPSTAAAYASALRSADDAFPSSEQQARDEESDESAERTRLLRQQMLLLPAGDQPCALKAAGSAAATAVLGYALGAIPAMFRRQWGFIHFEGLKSARHLALVSGTYALVHCLVSRVRLSDDGWSRGAAGCATGLAMGWQAGPVSAAQSCAGIGLLSYLLDFGGAGAAGGGGGEAGGGGGPQQPRPLTQGVAHAAEVRRRQPGGVQDGRSSSAGPQQLHDRGAVGALVAAAAAAASALTAAAQGQQRKQQQEAAAAGWPSLLLPGGLPAPTLLAIGVLGGAGPCFGLGGGQRGAACAVAEGGAAAASAGARRHRRRVEW